MKRNKFSLSNYKLLTANMGELVPIGLQEVLPGDVFKHSTSLLMRLSPLLAPVMHPCQVQIHHWFVPNRIVWDDWEDFITGGETGADNSTFPYITTPASTGFAVGSLADYLGVPTGVPDIQVNALPFRAYATIFNEYFRDQDLQTTPAVVDTTDGSDTTTNTSLLYSNWEKDYFTTARPTSQKGSEITLPLGTTAPVDAYGVTSGNVTQLSAGSGPSYSVKSDVESVSQDIEFIADLSAATGIPINTLRLSIAAQKYEETMLRYGGRYAEYCRSQFGIAPLDARLQRPEYLAGGRQTIQFSEVLQTGVDSTDAGLGDMGGHGIAALKSNNYLKVFQEHGFVITTMTVRPKAIYADGLFRHWSRTTKEDFFQKQYAHVGMQEVKNKEVYMAHTTPEGTFGYQDRYDEYRRAPSSISGDFRTTLDHWHLGRLFSSDPALNETFIKGNSISKRIFADQTDDVLWIMAHHKIGARRCLPKVGTPSGL